MTNRPLRRVQKSVQSLSIISTFPRPSKYLIFHFVRLDMVEVAGSSPVVPTKLTPNNDNLQTVIHRPCQQILYQYICYWKILEGSDCAKNVQSFFIDCEGVFPNLSDAYFKILIQMPKKSKTSLCGGKHHKFAKKLTYGGMGLPSYQSKYSRHLA